MSQRIEVVLDDQGRLVLPASVQRELGLTAGSTLVVERQTADAGGATYDALILHAATKVEVDRITTVNEGDFRRVYPAVADKVVAP